MNTTEKKDSINTELDNLTSMDLGNSFDYVHDYYITSYDYSIDTEDYVIEPAKIKGCNVVSTNDSINIIHDNGTDKHIQKKKYESASKKYNDKKIAKEKLAAKKKETIAKKNTNTSNYNASSSTYSTKTTYNNVNTSVNSTPRVTTNTSHTEVFGNTNTKKNTNIIKVILFLFILLPYIASIFFSCVSEIFYSLFE